VKGVRSIDNKNLEDIYRRYYNELYLYSLALCKNHHIAQELVSDTFYKALLTIDESHNNIKFWLFRVAKNSWIDKLKKQKRLDPTPIDSLQLVESGDLLEKIIAEEEKRRIYLEILKLREKQQEIIILYYYSGFSLDEIAQTLNISPGAVRTMLCRSRKKLKSILKEDL